MLNRDVTEELDWERLVTKFTVFVTSNWLGTHAQQPFIAPGPLTMADEKQERDSPVFFSLSIVKPAAEKDVTNSKGNAP